LAEHAGENTGMTPMRAVLLVNCPQWTARPPLRSKVKPVVKATIPLLDSKSPSTGQARVDFRRERPSRLSTTLRARVLGGTEI